MTENELFAQFVLLSGSKIYFFWQKYTSQTKCFFGSLSNWSLCFYHGRYELLPKILLNIMPMPLLISKTMMHIAGTSRWRARMLSRGGHCCCRCYRESQHSCTARESGSEPWMLRNNLEHKLIMKTPFNLDTRHPVQATIRTLSISYRDDNREI